MSIPAHYGPLFDIGANLTNRGLAADFHSHLDAAASIGLTDLSITAAHPDNTDAALQMIASYKGSVQLSTTAGVHPHLAEQTDAQIIARIAAHAQSGAIAAVGETGLDYFRMLADPKAQQASFIAHIEIAASSGLPLFLHQREAHQDFVRILRTYRARLGRVVVHCFTDNQQALEDYLALDCSIGITGWVCDAKRGLALQQLVRLIPNDRIMIETDSPYLLPEAAKTLAKGRQNVPQYLPFVLETLAECRQQDPAELAAITTANARQFFQHSHA